MKNVLVGVDVGSTMLKVAAFDATTGRTLCARAKRLRLQVGRDGTREQSTASLDRALASAFGELRGELGRRWSAVAGIGLAAQGGSGIIVDRCTGKALTPMILWNDTRALRHASKIGAKRPADFWRELTWRDEPGHGLGKILWLKATRPGVFKPGNMYVGAGEYCYFRMTGLWRQDACNALQIGCYNVPQRRLDRRLLDLVGMPLSFVAPLREGHETNGLSREGARRLGLPAGTPVAGPYMDHEAGYLSAVGISNRPLQCSLGTAWVGNFVMPERAHWTSPFQFVVPAVVGKGRLVIQPLLTGNVTWDWALAQFVDRDHGKALAKVERLFSKELLPPDGLTALPWFNVANPLRATAVGGGGFFGMSPTTGNEDMLRALAASMVYEMARVFENLKRRMKVDSVVLGGGASKGRFFRALFAALFDPLPVFYLEEEDLSGVRGVLYGFSREVCRARSKRVPRPSKALRGRIMDGYNLYLAVFDRMYGDVVAGEKISF